MTMRRGQLARGRCATEIPSPTSKVSSPKYNWYNVYIYVYARNDFNERIIPRTFGNFAELGL